jgi:hypothetical protein
MGQMKQRVGKRGKKKNHKHPCLRCQTFSVFRNGAHKKVCPKRVKSKKSNDLENAVPKFFGIFESPRLRPDISFQKKHQQNNCAVSSRASNTGITRSLRLSFRFVIPIKSGIIGDRRVKSHKSSSKSTLWFEKERGTSNIFLLKIWLIQFFKYLG